jgi:50S ribosomal protein L16 3-hydroxylase
MQTQQPLAMLGGLTASEFMQRYWQKKPLLVRQAFPQFKPLLSRQQLFELAASPEVGSRLVQGKGRDWQMRHGPLNARQRPAFAQPHWTCWCKGWTCMPQRRLNFCKPFDLCPMHGWTI